MPPTTLPPPEHDPDGSELMASLRARVASGATQSDPRASQYQPALAAVQALVLRRRDLGGSLTERERLEAIQRDLQALARGI
jgi:hypothetical protein